MSISRVVPDEEGAVDLKLHKQVKEELCKDPKIGRIISATSRKGSYQWIHATERYISPMQFTLSVMPRLGIRHPKLPDSLLCPGCRTLLDAASAMTHIPKKIKRRSKGTGGQSKVPWPRLGDEERKASFQQAVWEMAKKEEEITWEHLSENMVHTAKRLSKMDRTTKTTNAPTGTENTPPGTETLRISGFRDLFLQSRKPDHFKEVLKEHGEEIEAQIGQECDEIEAGLRRNRSNPWRTLRRICGLYRETLCIETSSTRETLLLKISLLVWGPMIAEIKI